MLKINLKPVIQQMYEKKNKKKQGMQFETNLDFTVLII